MLAKSRKPAWKAATIVCAVLIGIFLLVGCTIAAVTASDTLVLKRAIVKAAGESPAAPPLSDLPLPSLPATNALYTPFGRFAAELVARLEHYKSLAPPGTTPGPVVPSVLTQLGTFSSDSGKFNGWLLRDANGTLWLVFRGTATKDEWEKDLQLRQVPFVTRMSTRAIRRIAYPVLMNSPLRTDTTVFPPDIGVHSGFLDIYLSLRPMILTVLHATTFSRLVVTGHSLGAAHALYATLDLSAVFPNVTFDTIVFGAPRAGNSAFAAALLALPNVNSLVLLANTCDLVTNIPLAVQPTLEAPYLPLIYTHPGAALHMFTDNRGGWIANHMINVYMDYLHS